MKKTDMGTFEESGFMNVLRSNGRSKHPEDINVLEYFLNKYNTSPKLYRIHSDRNLHFNWEMVRKKLKKFYKDSKIIFKDVFYDIDKNIQYTKQETWDLRDGLVLQLEGSISEDFYMINHDVEDHVEVFTYDLFLVRDEDFPEMEKIAKIFKSCQIKEIENITIGMVSYDDGSFYVKDFDIKDKINEVKHMDLHYGEGFEEFDAELLARLKNETKGLVLFHGVPGSGKCVTGKTKIKVRNKRTGVEEEIEIEKVNTSLKIKNNDVKFIESNVLDEYEVYTDNGWVDTVAIHKTVEYDIWVIETKDFSLECADKHILFNEKLEEVYVENLKKGDHIITENGIQEVISVTKTDRKENMYDLELNESSNKRYYTNGILSHNTTYIRHLLRKLKESNTTNNILYYPPTMVGSITDPSFINFISEWVSDSKGKNYLLIEDAEPLLESRDQSRNMGITNLLNLTDGLLNDILSIQIIATFNTQLENIDKALLRPERLIARKEFKPLTIEKGRILAEKIGINPDLIIKELTLAELYSMKKETKPILHDIAGKKAKIGFGSKDSD